MSHSSHGLNGTGKEKWRKMQKKGRVVQNIADQYVVQVERDNYICKARGKMKQLEGGIVVGDFVFIEPEERTKRKFGCYCRCRGQEELLQKT